MRPLDLHLRTDLRSEERRLYEQRRKDKEAEMEGARQQVRIVKTQLHPHQLELFFISGLKSRVSKLW